MSRGKSNKSLRSPGARRAVIGELPGTITSVEKFQKIYSITERNEMARSQEILDNDLLFPWIIQDESVRHPLIHNQHLKQAHVERLIRELINLDAANAIRTLIEHPGVGPDILDEIVCAWEKEDSAVGMPKHYVGYGPSSSYRWWGVLLMHPKLNPATLDRLVDLSKDPNRYIIDFLLLKRPEVLNHSHLKRYIQDVNRQNEFTLKIIFAHPHFDQELLELLPKRAGLEKHVEGVVMRHKRELPRKFPDRFTPLPKDPKIKS